MDDWMFEDVPNTAVLTTRVIVQDGAWVARVTHDAEDGAWQFHHDAPGPPSEDEAMVVSLRSIWMPFGAAVIRRCGATSSASATSSGRAASTSMRTTR